MTEKIVVVVIVLGAVVLVARKIVRCFRSGERSCCACKGCGYCCRDCDVCEGNSRTMAAPEDYLQK